MRSLGIPWDRYFVWRPPHLAPSSCKIVDSGPSGKFFWGEPGSMGGVAGGVAGGLIWCKKGFLGSKYSGEGTDLRECTSTFSC